MVTIIRDRVQAMIDEGHDARAGEGRQADGGLRAALRRDDRVLDDRHVRRGGLCDTRARRSSRDPRSCPPCSWRRRPWSPVSQGQGRQGGAPPPRAAAPIDLTGTWVSVVTEDWRWRMRTPPKGDYASLPLNDAATKAADAWDPARTPSASSAAATARRRSCACPDASASRGRTIRHSRSTPQDPGGLGSTAGSCAGRSGCGSRRCRWPACRRTIPSRMRRRQHAPVQSGPATTGCGRSA